MRSRNEPLPDLPELALDWIAKLLDNEDKLRLMASSKKAAQVCMGSGRLRLRICEGVKWMRLKQVLPWTKGLSHLTIQTSKYYQPVDEQADQQDMEACNVVLGPAYDSHVQGLSFPDVEAVTIKAKGLPCIVPHFIAAVCPNLSTLIYQPADSRAPTFVGDAPMSAKSLPIPLCTNLRHIECQELWLPPAYHTSEDLRRQLPNVTSLSLKELTPDWFQAWSDQLTMLQLCHFNQSNVFGKQIHTAGVAKKLQHLTIMQWDGALPINAISPALKSLALPGHRVLQERLHLLPPLIDLQSLTAVDLVGGIYGTFDFNLGTISPSLRSLELSHHNLTPISLRLIMQLNNLKHLKVGTIGNLGDADFSSHNCTWERFEVLGTSSLDFEQLIKLPLGNVKELTVNSIIHNGQEFLALSIPHHSNLPAMLQLRGSFKLNIKERRYVRYQWHMDRDNSDGTEAAAIFSAVAALLKPVPTLDLNNFHRASAYLSAVVDWASSAATHVLTGYQALSYPGFVQSLQQLPLLQAISADLTWLPNQMQANKARGGGAYEWFNLVSSQVIDTVTTHLVTPTTRPLTLQLSYESLPKSARQGWAAFKHRLSPYVRIGDVEWKMEPASFSNRPIVLTAAMATQAVPDACDYLQY